MNIVELAKEYGWEATNSEGFYFEHQDIEDFAQAVIENYKASLVPVMWMWYDKPHDEKVYSDDNSPKPSNAIPLFALPTSSKNELLSGETK